MLGIFEFQNLLCRMKIPFANVEAGTGLIEYSGSNGIADFRKADIGDIVPPGFATPEELSTFFSRAFYGTWANPTTGADSSFGVFDLILNSEPDSKLAIAFGLVFIVLRARSLMTS